MTTYECQKCKAPVTVKEQKVVRSCECRAPVIANLRATAYGKGSLK